MPKAKKLRLQVKHLFLVIFLSCTLLSCKTSNIHSTTPELTFGHLRNIHLNVANITVFNKYKMPFKRPNVEHVAPISPGASLERWVSDIIVPVGNKLDAQFIIKSGSIIESELKTQKGLKGIFAIEQSKRYTATIDVQLEIFDRSHRLATINATAKRSHTLREDATPNLKTNLLFNLVENLMATFDKELRRQVDTHLQKYIRKHL
tara:strand:- start:1510 stop:2124 length:615 start_codon:yes stop_codon:yes gene_type:complete